MDSDSNVNSNIYREQFKHLQKQHQRNLHFRKQMLFEGPSAQKVQTCDTKSDCNTSSFNNFGVGCEIEDNLELGLEKEYNEHASVKHTCTCSTDGVTRELKDENGRLRKLLAERDEEMRILRKQVNQERQNMVGSGLAADTAAHRIMELSKKNRELASDIEKEKRKVKQLSKKLNDTDNQSLSALNDINKNQRPAEKHLPDQEEIKLKDLQEKLKQALAKVADYRNQCEILKREARLTQKALAKECGDNINITAILNEPSGWRGRQQQITTLQNKVNELKQQLGSATSAKVVPQSGNVSKPTLNFQRVTTPSLYDEKHRQTLRRLEMNKKETYEKVSTELETLSEEHRSLQMKFDAAKTRNKILTTDLKGLKIQTKMLVQKGAHDDELIAALMREQEKLQKTLEKKNSQVASDKSKCRQEKDQQDSELVLKLTQLCKEREEKVTKLENELKAMVTNGNHNPSHAHGISKEVVDKTTVTDNYLTSTTLSPVNDYQRVRQNGPCIPTPPNPSADSPSRARRIIKSPGGSFTPPISPKLREGCSRKLEEYQTLYESLKVERDRLLELVPILQEREEVARQSVYKMSCDVRKLQRENVEIEKKLASISASQNSSRHEKQKKHQKPRRQIGVPNEETMNNTYQAEELQTRLAIQTDENDALKEALDATLQGKKEDFLFYQEVVEQTKQVFLQGLRHYRKTSAPNT